MENKRFSLEFCMHTSVNIFQVVHQAVYTGLPLSPSFALSLSLSLLHCRKSVFNFRCCPLVFLVVALVVLFVFVALNISTLCGNHVNFTFAMFVVVYVRCSCYCCCNGQFLPATLVKIHQATNQQGAGGSRGRVESTICHPSPSLGAIDSHIIGSKKYTNK